jgi:hypothetical protein
MDKRKLLNSALIKSRAGCYSSLLFNQRLKVKMFSTLRTPDRTLLLKAKFDESRIYLNRHLSNKLLIFRILRTKRLESSGL